MKRLAAALISVAALMAGCGAGTPMEGRIPGRTLRIYVSGPMTGAASSAARAAIAGAQLALAEHGTRLGRYRITLSVLNDATAASNGWDPSQATVNAHQAAQDTSTIGYIGDFTSGATAISLPILNRAGIPQVSPTGGAVGLTSSASGASPGEPAKYYPSGKRTFVRVAPNDAVEAAVAVRTQERLGCRSRFVLQDGTVDAEDAVISYVLAAQAAGLHVLGVQSFQRQATDYVGLADGLARLAPDCVLIAGTDERSAARVVTAVARSLPAARIFATSALADGVFADPAYGGVPLAFDPRVVVFSPALSASSYPQSGRAFLARYERTYGASAPQAIFGYEAMSLMLAAITRRPITAAAPPAAPRCSRSCSPPTIGTARWAPTASTATATPRWAPTASTGWRAGASCWSRRSPGEGREKESG